MAQTEAAKEARPKTGGRVKKDVQQLMSELRIRNEISGMRDDTTLPAELAAIYLGISVKQLGELRKRSPQLKNGSKEEKAKGPQLIKYLDKEAVGMNQPVFYKLGALRKYQAEHSGYDTFEAVVAGGLLGWVSTIAPFLAQPQKRGDKGRLYIVGKAFGWSSKQDVKEERIRDVLDGKLRIVWIPPAQAIGELWEKTSHQRAFAKPWLALLKAEVSAAKSAIERTALHSATQEGLDPSVEERTRQSDASVDPQKRRKGGL